MILIGILCDKNILKDPYLSAKLCFVSQMEDMVVVLSFGPKIGEYLDTWSKLVSTWNWWLSSRVVGRCESLGCLASVWQSEWKIQVGPLFLPGRTGAKFIRYFKKNKKDVSGPAQSGD